MSRHPSELPADWLPSSADPATGAGPDIAHDEYGLEHEGYGLVPGENGADRHGLAPGEYGVVYDDYGLAHEPAADTLREVGTLPDPGDAGSGFAADPRSGGSAARLAMLAYLTVPLFGFVVPLVVYLRALRGPSWTRAHAAQALNAWITAIMYDLSAVIMGAMLALDSPQIALIVFGPLVVGLWLVTLVFLVRAGTAASQGKEYTFPRWLCSPIVR